MGAFLGSSGGAGAVAVPAVPPTDVEVLGLIVLMLVGALGIAIPVALVYQWTSEPQSYRRDFSRALLSSPIAVALAVFLVKNNLALAFSLTGIVAVILWRATLRETMDGVFMFMMIGIGLAAGVQLLLVALVASIVFNVMTLTSAHGSRAVRVSSPADLVAPRPGNHGEGEGRDRVSRRHGGSSAGRGTIGVDSSALREGLGEGRRRGVAGRPRAARIPRHAEEERDARVVAERDREPRSAGDREVALSRET